MTEELEKEEELYEEDFCTSAEFFQTIICLDGKLLYQRYHCSRKTAILRRDLIRTEFLTGGGMASNLVVVDSSLPISSKSGLIDWSLCFIFQNDTGEKLTNPERSRYLFFLKRQFKKKLRKEMSFLSVLLLLQVTAAVLYNLMLTAYEKSVQSADDTPTESFEDWYNKKSNTVPQFKYWDMVLKLELVVLQLIKSLRSTDFSVYKDSLSRLIGWFFVCDQVLCARWLAVHIRDLANLLQTRPDVNTNFETGNFVAMKTKRAFSAIALDQNHEQVNACLKGDGGKIQ
ncbi:hypothetical protein FQA39_LY05760 [Lamprigera yunnana]|nr:hypothetical protein FQA39_LY05760 [Lamprigera yunnana]